MNKYLTVHMHCYQPPREDPWLGYIEMQPSAAPSHDWNERINDECYEPNGFARIMGDGGRVASMVNNYEFASFNIGPTLLTWMEQHAPITLARVIDGDRKSRERNNGHGNAIAQVYNHVIMPLASERDRETQVKWGIAVFEQYFGRKPEGMHLAETAVDTATLEVLARNGIKFTVLAPRQAKRWRKMGSDSEAWQSEGGIDPTRGYLCRLPSGATINLFFYDGPISQAVAFERLLESGDKFKSRILSGFSDKRQHDQLVHLAVDGETFGHHFRFGEMCLAWVIDQFENSKEVTITNYGRFLELNPPQDEAEIHENSSWSCVHGVERWRSDCGCQTGDGNGKWQLRWRQPLREALDDLHAQLVTIFECEGAKLFTDPWQARNAYVGVVTGARDASSFLDEQMLAGTRSQEADTRAFELLEMSHMAMLMYTSCAWFFDDIGRIEPIQALCYATRAIELAEKVTGKASDFEDRLVKTLEKAPSNMAEFGNGADVYSKRVRRVALKHRVDRVFKGPLDTVEAVEELLPILESAEKHSVDINRWKLQHRLVSAWQTCLSRGVSTPELRAAFELAAEKLHLYKQVIG